MGFDTYEFILTEGPCGNIVKRINNVAVEDRSNFRRYGLFVVQIRRKKSIERMEPFIVTGYSDKLLFCAVPKINTQDGSDAALLALAYKLEAPGSAVDVGKGQCFDAVGFCPIHQLVD